MPRKGRLVQPRHIFPWISAPYIEMLRILWRIERFCFLPIRYLHAWTVAAIFGVLGVLFSVALFIPQLAGSQAEASSRSTRRPLINRHDLPIIPEDDLVLPAGYAPRVMEDGESLVVQMERLHLNFDDHELVTTHSEPHVPLRSSLVDRSSLAHGTPWSHHLVIRDVPDESAPTHPSYLRHAQRWPGQPAAFTPEYVYDPEVTNPRQLMEKSPTLRISKSVPPAHAPDEPLTYVITVTNNGSEPIESAIVTEEISDLSRVIQCEPRAMVSADHKFLVWELGVIQPDENHELRVTIQPDKRRIITQDTLVSFSSAPVVAEMVVRARAQPVEPIEPAPREPEPQPAKSGRPQLVITFDPPEAVQVGEELKAYYTISNIGTADATDIRLLVEVPRQLRHRYGELVEHKISRLAPRDERRALFAALAEDSGRLPLHWTLEAQGLANQADSEWVAVLPGSVAKSPVVGNPGLSTIPSREPTLIDDETLSAPVESLTPESRTAPPPGSSIPYSPFGPRPHTVTEPSSIPAWSSSAPVRETLPPADRGATLPILPELTPEEAPRLYNSVQPPSDIVPLETAAPFPKSTVPPNGLASPELGGVREN